MNLPKTFQDETNDANYKYYNYGTGVFFIDLILKRNVL